ncbi:TetR/AcrR family transcriptional regulator [Vibrio alginolyticus]
MANTKKFQRDEVVKAASDLFWKKGFHATSTRDLQDSVNLRPGSIYATFGSKEGLYCEALKMYVANLQALFELHLAQNTTVLDAIEAFAIDVVINQRDSNPSEVCMLVKSASEFAEDFNALRNQTNSLANQFESFLAKLFERAIENGEIEAQDTLLLAQLFQVQFTGIRAYSYRSDDVTLKTLISIMVDSFRGNVPKQNAE